MTYSGPPTSPHDGIQARDSISNPMIERFLKLSEGHLITDQSFLKAHAIDGMGGDKRIARA